MSLVFQADGNEAADMTLCKEVGELLHGHYPGHLWAVWTEGSVIKISNLRLSGRFCYILHTDKLTDGGVRRRKVIQAGGELLERAHWKRKGYEGEDATVLEGAKGWHAIDGRGAI